MSIHARMGMHKKKTKEKNERKKRKKKTKEKNERKKGTSIIACAFLEWNYFYTTITPP
jgi:hypothetical protein